MKTKEKNIFIVTIVFMLVVLALMVTYNFLSFYKNAVSNMESIGNSSLATEISEINSYLSQSTNMLKATADNVEFMIKQDASANEIEKYLKYENKKFRNEIDENFTGVYGYVDNQYIDGSDWIPEADYTPTSREWYIAASEAKGKTVIVPPYVDASTNDVIISVSSMLGDGESVISIDIVLNRIQEITESIHLDDMGYAFIVDNSGLVIAHNDSGEVGKNYLSDPDMSPLLAMVEESEYFNIDFKGENNYVFTGSVNESWRVIMMIPSSGFLKSSRDILVKNIMIVIVVYAAVIFFSIFAFRKMRESIEELDKKQKQVENANKNLEQSKDIINKIAYSNLITDLKNRYSLDSDIKERLISDYVNIACFDIDNFRSINETFGYDFGDNLLAAIAETLSKQFGRYAEIYHIFSNEFCFVFNKDISQKQAEEITSQIFEAIKNKYLIGNIYLQVNVSGTLYRSAPKEYTSASSLLIKAESIVNEIKKNGGNYCKIN